MLIDGAFDAAISRFFEYGAERWDDMVMGEAERFDIVYANQVNAIPLKSTFTRLHNGRRNGSLLILSLREITVPPYNVSKPMVGYQMDHQ